LRARNVDANAFQHSTVFLRHSDSRANEFLREKIGVSAVNKIYQEQIPVGLWGTRYLKDNDPEEYFVVLSPTAHYIPSITRLPRGRPEASLSKEEAVALAEKYLREEKKLDLTGWSLEESSPRNSRTVRITI